MSGFAEGVVPGAMQICARMLAARCVNFTMAGTEHVPSAGAAVLIARHYHHFYDGLVLMAALARPVHILVTLDWAQNTAVSSGMRLLTELARWPVILRRDALLRSTHKQIFNTTDVLRYQRRGLRAAVDLLVTGRLLVVFPEGYATIDPHYTPKTLDSELLPFKAGLLAIAKAAERRTGGSIPLIPVGLHYVREKTWRVRVAFGSALRTNDFDSQDAMLKKLEWEVARLSGLDLRGEDPNVH
jgi:putative membrane protein